MELRGSLSLLHQKILTKARLSEMTHDLQPQLPALLPTSLPLPLSKHCHSSRGDNTSEGSFYIHHWAKLYMCPEGK